MVTEVSTSRKKKVSWWESRTKMERRLIPTLTIAAVVIIALVIAVAIAGRSIKANQYCTTEVCITEAALLLSRMNTSINPCDDFYQFVCGRYIEEAEIPDDKTELDALGLIGDLVNNQVRNVIMEPTFPDEARPFAMIKKMFRSCMNTSAIEETSLEQMKSFLSRLGGWPIVDQEKWIDLDWINLTYRLRQLGFSTDHFITMDIDINSKNSTEFIVSIDEWKNEEINESNLKHGLEDELVQAYADYLIDLAVLFGAEKEFATKEVHDLIEFRANLAKFVVSKSEHYKLLINASITTITELQDRYPSIPWLNLLNGALAIPNITLTGLSKVAVATPRYIAQFEKLIGNTTKRVLVNHALFEVVRSSINFLPKVMRKRELAFLASATGATESRPRWNTCINTATQYFNLAADALYVRKYGNDAAKSEVIEMVSRIMRVFVDLLTKVEWMDKETKQKAVEKAEMMTLHVGFTTELRDEEKITEYYKGIEFDSDNVLELISEVSKFKRDKMVSFYGSQVVKNHWTTRAAVITSNAFYDPQENSIQIPAGIMQKEFYTKGKPNYMNYGGLGLVIGHEITHGFDSDGKWFDTMGNVVNWWERSTDEAFSVKARCFVEQYGNFTVPEIDLNLDGENTLAENIADNGGATEAYLAYLDWSKQNKAELPLPGLHYSIKQLFWISLANAWCTKSRQSSLEQIVLGDEHSPDRYRILGALSNLRYFAEDFNCPLGSYMNPIKKCRIW